MSTTRFIGDMGRNRKARVENSIYNNLGPPDGSPAYRPVVLKPWPKKVDFSQDEVSVRE